MEVLGAVCYARPFNEASLPAPARAEGRLGTDPARSAAPGLRAAKISDRRDVPRSGVKWLTSVLVVIEGFDMHIGTEHVELPGITQIPATWHSAVINCRLPGRRRNWASGDADWFNPASVRLRHGPV